jgi:hypothetical protein
MVKRFISITMLQMKAMKMIEKNNCCDEGDCLWWRTMYLELKKGDPQQWQSLIFLRRPTSGTLLIRGRRGRDRMPVGFITTYAISANFSVKQVYNAGGYEENWFHTTSSEELGLDVGLWYLMPFSTIFRGDQFYWWRKQKSYASWIYNYLCNQCLSPLTLWVWIPFMVKCTGYNIMW